MKVGMCYSYEELNVEMAVAMIPKGFEPVKCRLEHGKSIIKNENIKILVTDQMNEKVISELKSEYPDIWIFLVYRPSRNYDNLMKIVKLGKVELIEYASEPTEMADSIVNRVIRLNLREKERRLHLRVHPQAHESNHVTIILKHLGNRILNAKLMDLSCGGAAVQFSDSLEASLLEVGNVYDFVNIHLRGRKIRVIGRVVGKRGTFLGLKFEYVEDQFMHDIAEYVYYKLNQEDMNPLLNMR